MLSKTDTEIRQALIDSTYGYQHNENGAMLLITDEQMHAQRICDIVALVKKLVAADKIEFHVSVDKQHRVSFIKSSPLGMKIANLLQHGIHNFHRYFPMHQFNPYFDLLEKHGLARKLFCHRFLAPHDHESATALVDILNGFVTDIRKEARSAKFTRFRDNYVRPTNKSYRSLTGYIDQIFDRHPHQFVLRMDFCYKNINSYFSAEDNKNKFDDLTRHRKALQEFLESNAIFGDNTFSGSSWKVEHGLGKSFNLHALMFFNAETLPKDIDLSGIIGNHWTTEITHGQGLYFDCSAYPMNYKRCGTGIIGAYDHAGQAALRKAALYLTKTALFIKFLAPKKQRTFGRKIRERIKTTDFYEAQRRMTFDGAIY